MVALRRRYELLFDAALQQLATNMQQYVSNRLSGIQFIDRVSARAKSIDSFTKKASSTSENGSPKYQDPFEEIQDMLGVRIVVFYPQTLFYVDDMISSYFTRYEETDKQPESDSEFGYEGKHYILRIPAELKPKTIPQDLPECFEMQVKTLYQHAWSEASHDLIYKGGTAINSDQRRRVAYAAASSWGADQILRQLVNEILPDYPSRDD